MYEESSEIHEKSLKVDIMEIMVASLEYLFRSDNKNPSHEKDFYYL